MGMVIHDDYWEAAKLLPKAQQTPFLMALLAYGMEGAEPDGRPPWLATFVAFRGRMDLGRKRSRAGAQAEGKPKPRKSGKRKQNKDLLSEDAEAKHTDKEKQNKDLPSRVEDEVEDEVEKEGENPPTPLEASAGGIDWDADDPRAAFLAEAMAAWSEVTGQPPGCYPSPEAQLGLYRAFDAGCTVDDERLVVRSKVAEWGNDPEMCGQLRPGVVFGGRFGEYLAVAKSQMDQEEDYGRYD